MNHRTRIDVLPIQEAVASASPSAWRDGLVTTSGPGVVSLALLDGGAYAVTTRAAPEPGEPVAIHPVAELIAVGDTWFAARRRDDNGPADS
ncbi:MAG: nuclease [Cellulomonadaceae bacterium]|nr:nuclease [Cellulomonadaceae bacterium]